MNHFIYSMKSTDRAPAAGGDMKSWFEYYKWDVDGHTFIPMPEDVVGELEPGATSILWFAMDGILLGCVPVEGFHPTLSMEGQVELHYNTQLMQVAPTGDLAIITKDQTGRIANRAAYDDLKKHFDVRHPPRNAAAAEGLQQPSV